MLLTLTSTSPPATDLGFLLHKNPAAVRSVSMNWGTAHVFYPVADADRCTAALLCEVDPVALVRRSRGGPFPLAAYVNDRPYAASSLLAAAIRKVFGTALRGECAERPGLADALLDLSAHLPVLATRSPRRPSRWTPRFPPGVRALISTSGSLPRAGCGTSSGSCTCCCRCWTTTSTTG
jgi:hypothetical protein